jgi:hypothetical protein
MIRGCFPSSRSLPLVRKPLPSLTPFSTPFILKFLLPGVLLFRVCFRGFRGTGWVARGVPSVH